MCFFGCQCRLQSTFSLEEAWDGRGCLGSFPTWFLVLILLVPHLVSRFDFWRLWLLPVCGLLPACSVVAGCPFVACCPVVAGCPLVACPLVAGCPVLARESLAGNAGHQRMQRILNGKHWSSENAGNPQLKMQAARECRESLAGNASRQRMQRILSWKR